MSANESSDESSDEDEVNRNFEAEAQLIIETDTLPKKSAERYLLVYETYKKWKTEHKNALSQSEEDLDVFDLKPAPDQQHSLRSCSKCRGRHQYHLTHEYNFIRTFGLVLRKIVYTTWAKS
jgi:hypothetical protein